MLNAGSAFAGGIYVIVLGSLLLVLSLTVAGAYS